MKVFELRRALLAVAQDLEVRAPFPFSNLSLRGVVVEGDRAVLKVDVGSTTIDPGDTPTYPYEINESRGSVTTTEGTAGSRTLTYDDLRQAAEQMRAYAAGWNLPAPAPIPEDAVMPVTNSVWYDTYQGGDPEADDEWVDTPDNFP